MHSYYVKYCFSEQYTLNRMDKNVSYVIEVLNNKFKVTIDEKNYLYIASSSPNKDGENTDKNSYSAIS